MKAVRGEIQPVDPIESSVADGTAAWSRDDLPTTPLPDRPNCRTTKPAVAAEPFAVPGYELLRRIGRGGMGEIYLANRANEAGVPVRCVLKTVLPRYQGDSRFEDLFLDEARIVASLRHPNIVSVIDVGRAGDWLYLAMEWVDGLNTAELVRGAGDRQGGVPLRHALFVIKETLQGLHHAHTAVDEAGRPLAIVHRDISPENILISRQGAVKLADFGVALGAANRVQHNPNEVAGKLPYFSPEVLQGRPASQKADLFALGVILYELLSSRPLFVCAGGPEEVAQAVRSFDPRALLEKDLTLPDGLEPILLRALAPDPAHRYDSALAFLEDINDFAYESGLRLLDAHFADYVNRLLPALADPGRKPSSHGHPAEEALP